MAPPSHVAVCTNYQVRHRGWPTPSRAGTIGLMPAEPPPPPPVEPKRTRAHVTSEDLARFGDEELIRRESNDEWLRDEVPPHH